MLQTAQAPAQPKGRPRSNSLQRMLDLEKKLNFQRTHQGSVPPSPACTDSSGSVPPSPGHQPRRFELVPKDKKVPPPVRNYSAVPPPLFSAHSAPGRSESPNMIPRKPVGHGISPAASTEQLKQSSNDKPAHKTVAFAFPPDVEEQRSLCQSPTWEAYSRQKKEKKEEKRRELERKEEEKRKEKEKEREQAMNQALEEAWKNAPKPRGRKLSKPQPPPPSMARSTTEPPPPPQTVQQKRRSRSSSLLGFSIGRNNDDPEEPRRSRSSSLTSLFRKSFGVERASFDETSSTGFLGGKKLENKKEDFHQKVLEDQAKGDSKVHPAMRKTFLGHGSFTPLKITPQHKEEDAKKRAYPPISINTSGARGQSMKSPKSPQRRGSVNIYLWSARARRGSVSDDCAVADDTEDEGDQNTAHTPDSEILYNKAQGLNRRGGVYVKKDGSEDGEQKTGPAHRSSNQSIKQTTLLNTKPKDADSLPKPKQDTITVSRPPIVSSTQDQPRRSSAASGLSIPPTPPRRSSKRRGSLTLLTRLNHSQPPSDEPSTAPVGGTSSSRDKLFRYNPPSIRYEQTSPGVRPKPITTESEPAVSSRWSIRDAAKSAFSRGHSAQNSVSSTMSKESATSKYSTASSVGPPVPPKNDMPPAKGLNVDSNVPIRTQHIHVPVKHLSPEAAHSPTTRRPTTSSSESSYSDAILSVSPMSTPHTSPPQSEMGHSPNIASIKPSMHAGPVSPYWSYTNSPQMAPSDFEPDDTIDLQEAANRVMEAFSNANLRSSTPRRKTPLSSSDETSLASTPTHAYPPLKHKPRSKGRLRSPTQGHRPTLSDPEATLKTLRRQSNLENLHQGEPTAKMFVECCACTRYHDMPSRLYEAMSNPDGVLSASSTDFAGSVTMTVKCPWCKHEMSTKCCAGFAAMVYVKERFH
ncbi:hypothetical protein F53441_10628 [Fusarium austroafricanum]|uniref:Uncharacterized protein n=1 Tax=Fusarium austroafricanum TaxID=2364996 RepID=A0A8H4NP33_9HYPO|nr:hypothetical protein F53441_10628 [Fusarium austroafricanum]